MRNGTIWERLPRNYRANFESTPTKIKGNRKQGEQGGLSKNHLPGGLITADRREWVPNEKKEPQRGIALPSWEASGE